MFKKKNFWFYKNLTFLNDIYTIKIVFKGVLFEECIKIKLLCEKKTKITDLNVNKLKKRNKSNCIIFINDNKKSKMNYFLKSLEIVS